MHLDIGHMSHVIGHTKQRIGHFTNHFGQTSLPGGHAPWENVSAMLRETLFRVQRAAGINNTTLAKLLGCSTKTIGRYYARGGVLLPHHWETLARVVHPRDPQLAAELAKSAGRTLAEMGLERAPTREHLVDSILCVAADALQTTPRAMRPGLAAALERMTALGLTAEEVLATMAATPPSAAKDEALAPGPSPRKRVRGDT